MNRRLVVLPAGPQRALEPVVGDLLRLVPFPARKSVSARLPSTNPPLPSLVPVARCSATPSRGRLIAPAMITDVERGREPRLMYARVSSVGRTRAPRAMRLLEVLPDCGLESPAFALAVARVISADARGPCAHRPPRRARSPRPRSRSTPPGRPRASCIVPPARARARARDVASGTRDQLERPRRSIWPAPAPSPCCQWRWARSHRRDRGLDVRAVRDAGCRTHARSSGSPPVFCVKTERLAEHAERARRRARPEAIRPRPASARTVPGTRRPRTRACPPRGAPSPPSARGRRRRAPALRASSIASR